MLALQSRLAMFTHLLRAALACAVLTTASFHANAANYPCSGKKGGVSHCQSGKFICKDGSVSGSKKICS